MLKEKVVIITGGTGAIGSALCTTVASYGAHVAFTFKTQFDVAQKVKEDIETLGQRCVHQSLDGCNAQEIASFIQKVEETLGPPDALVNNLGMTQVMPFALIDEEDWDELIQVNLKSMFLFTKETIRSMIYRKSGVILNMSSIAGMRLLEVPVHYATTKAGVTGFTVSLAKEVCRYGIRINAIAPGLIEGGIGSNISERQQEEYNSYCALGRPGTPEEVAELSAFLISDRASYINGQTVTIDGGL